MSTTNKPHTLFWVIAVIALLWNLIGVGFFTLESFMMSDEILATMTDAQRSIREQAPTWQTYTYGIATIGGLLASILFILKRKLSVILFGVSLLCILINMCYDWFALDVGNVLGAMEGYVMPLIIVVLGIIFYFYSKGADQKGWLN